MQFFIALSVLAVASSAYLLHQFWTRSLTSDAAHPTVDDAASDESDAPNRLKAA